MTKYFERFDESSKDIKDFALEVHEYFGNDIGKFLISTNEKKITYPMAIILDELDKILSGNSRTNIMTTYLSILDIESLDDNKGGSVKTRNLPEEIETKTLIKTLFDVIGIKLTYKIFDVFVRIHNIK